MDGRIPYTGVAWIPKREEVTAESKIRTLGTLYANSFHADLDEVQRSRGTARRLVIRHPSAVILIPVAGPEGEVLVVTQYRYPLGIESVELPAGKLDPGEDPETAARRELVEETGYEAGRLKKLMSFAPAVGYSDEIIHIYVAEDLTPAQSGRDEEEITRVEKLPISRLKQMILDGRIIDGTTIVALAAYEWMPGIQTDY